MAPGPFPAGTSIVSYPCHYRSLHVWICPWFLGWRLLSFHAEQTASVLGSSLPFQGFPGDSDGKESACNAGDLGSIPGLGRSPGGGHGNPLQYSCLENPHGQRSLAGYSPWWRCKELDMTEQLSMHMDAALQTQRPFLSLGCALGSDRLRPTRKDVKSYLWLNIYTCQRPIQVNLLISPTKRPRGGKHQPPRLRSLTQAANKWVWKPDPPLPGPCSLHCALLIFTNRTKKSIWIGYSEKIHFQWNTGPFTFQKRLLVFVLVCGLYFN